MRPQIACKTAKKLAQPMKKTASKSMPASTIFTGDEANTASLYYLDQMVDKYMRKGRRMEVLEMRKNIRILTCVNFFPGKFHPMRKSRGLWQHAKPEGWPVGVPFCDPNNYWPKNDPANPNPEKKTKPGREVLAAMTDGLINIFREMKDNNTLILPDEALDEHLKMPVPTSDGIRDYNNTYVQHETPFINPTLSTKAIYEPTEVSGDNTKEAKIQQIVDGLKEGTYELVDGLKEGTYEMDLLEKAEQFVLDTLHPNNPLVEVYRNTEQLYSSSPFEQLQQKVIDQVKKEPLSPAAPDAATDVHVATDLMNVLQLREDQPQQQQEPNPLKQKFAMVQEEQTPLQYVQEEGLIAEEVSSEDANFLADIFYDTDYSKVNEMLSVQEQTEVLDSLPTYDYRQVSAQPQHQDDVNFNVQTRQVDEGFTSPPFASAVMSPPPPPTMVDITNMDVVGMPKTNHGELATGRSTAPVTFETSGMNQLYIQNGSEPVEQIVLGDEEDQVVRLGNGQLIHIKRMKAQPTPPPLINAVQAVDILSQAAQVSQIFPQTRQVVTETTGQRLVGQVNGFEAQNQQMDSSMNPLALGLPASYGLTSAPLASPPARYPVEETAGPSMLMDTVPDVGMMQEIPTLVEEMTVDDEY